MSWPKRDPRLMCPPRTASSLVTMARFKPSLAATLIGLVVVTGAGAATVIIAKRAGFGSVGREAGQQTTDLGDLGNVVVEVDASATRTRTISPYIYGVANADQATLRALNATVD